MKHVIWITGFSGAGKTTIAQLLQTSLKKHLIKSILLDGDDMRDALGFTEHYAFDDRKKIAYMYARIAKLLADQGFFVIVATISMFEEVREWNRRNNDAYFEVYLQVSEEERRSRDPKKLYTSIVQDMVAKEQLYEEPRNADLVFDNLQKLSPRQMVNKILEKILKMEETK